MEAQNPLPAVPQEQQQQREAMQMLDMTLDEIAQARRSASGGPPPGERGGRRRGGAGPPGRGGARPASRGGAEVASRPALVSRTSSSLSGRGGRGARFNPIMAPNTGLASLTRLRNGGVQRCDNCFLQGHIRKNCPLTVKLCFLCGSSQHDKGECPSQSETCPACGVIGHAAARCRSVLGSIAAPAAPGALVMPASSTSTFCWACGSGAHVKVNCPHLGKTCDICGQVGHLKATCQQAQGGPQIGSHPPGLTCYACGSTQHVKAQCPHTGKTCDNCGQLGHLKITCRSAPKIPGMPGNVGANDVCYLCGVTGHFARNCPQSTVTQ